MKKAQQEQKRAAAPAGEEESVCLDWLAADFIGSSVDEHPWACSAPYTLGGARWTVERGIGSRGEQVHPHHRAKLAAWAGIREPFGLVDVRARSTEDLVEALASVGVHLDAESLRERARGARSAWRLGESLSADPVEPAHLLGAVTTELWRRWMPDVPCYESVCDRIQEAYPLLDATAEQAAQAWLPAALDLMTLLPDNITRLDDADAEVGPLHDLGSWLGDLELGLMNLARVDSAVVEAALPLAQWWGRFDDLGFYAINLETMLLAFSGRQDEAVALFEARIAADPDDPMPYAFLSDLLTDGHPAVRRDPQRAMAVLRQALDRPLRDKHLWDLDHRLAYIETGS